VSAEHVGVAHRHVVLEVLVPLEQGCAQRAVAPPFDEQSGEFEVAALAGRAGELGEGDLDLGMPAHRRSAGGTELGVQMVGEPARDRRQLVVMARAKPGDGGLEEVAVTVQLVPPFEVAVSRTLSRMPEARVEVSVVVLCSGDPGHDSLITHLHGGIRSSSEFPGHGLEELVHLGVDELDTRVRTGSGAGQAIEVRDPADAFHPIEAVVDDDRRVQFLHPTPQAARDRHLAESEWAERPARGCNGATERGRD
jgi:hypothetical protein